MEKPWLRYFFVPDPNADKLAPRVQLTNNNVWSFDTMKSRQLNTSQHSPNRRAEKERIPPSYQQQTNHSVYHVGKR